MLVAIVIVTFCFHVGYSATEAKREPIRTSILPLNCFSKQTAKAPRQALAEGAVVTFVHFDQTEAARYVVAVPSGKEEYAASCATSLVMECAINLIADGCPLYCCKGK